jgi:exodeoxyribonuclease VII large subunit
LDNSENFDGENGLENSCDNSGENDSKNSQLEIKNSENSAASKKNPTSNRPGEIQPIFTPSDALTVINQALDYAFPNIVVEGEVANFKINQGKWVFFDIKDDSASLGCFMTRFNLRTAIEDGMRVRIRARVGLTKWGKFSLTVLSIQPIGEGSIRRAFEILRQKLMREGLFAPERKRALPRLVQNIGVISSVDAAGYKDFLKILGSRMGGLNITTAHTYVQGENAARQIQGALNFFNQLPNPPEVIAILRGGGSRDDLASFDDESLVRMVAASRVPVLTGIGHEIDTTLCDLAADVRASTPSNAAEILVPNRREIWAEVSGALDAILEKFERNLDLTAEKVETERRNFGARVDQILADNQRRLEMLKKILSQLNPRAILRRGYFLVRKSGGAILRGAARPGETLTIEGAEYLTTATAESSRRKA